MKKIYFQRFSIIIALFVMVFSVETIHADKISETDSLIAIIDGNSAENDKVEALLELANHYQLVKEEAMALNIANKALLKAISLKNTFAIARARFLITSLTTDFLHYDSTVYYLKISIEDFEKANAQKELASAQNLLGIIYEKQGKYNQAIKCYFKALFIFDQLSDQKGIANEYNNIGLVFNMERHYQRALLYFNRALKIGNELHDESIITNALSNMAICYQEQKLPEKALEYFNRVYEIDLKRNDTRNLGLTYNNLGVVYFDLKKYALAKEYLLRAATLKTNDEELEGLANTYNNLGSVYTKLKNDDSALFYLQMAVKIAREEGSLPVLKEAYDNYSDFYEQKGDLVNAFDYIKKSNALNDSIILTGSAVALSQLENDYLSLSTEKREFESASNKEKSKLRLRLYVVSLLLVVIVFGFLFYYIVKVKKSNKHLQIKQKKIEIQNKILQVKNIEILQAKEAAEEAAKVKTQFISTISHEIRTPLNAIIGVANLLNQNSPQPAQYENLNILKISSENLLSLVNNILDFSKMEAGKMQLETIDFNLRSIVFDVKELFSIKSVEKGVELLIQYDEKIPSVLKGDPLRINQLLINLVNNAIKFTDSGYVKIDISLQLSTINHALVHFAISDTGIGISQSKQSAIFESFAQADTNTTRKYGGTGLGLSICKKILENLNSKLQLESVSGKGSTFYFTINFEVSRNASIGKSAKTASFEDSIKGKRVLIVEDNMMNVMVLRQFLQKWGIITEVALNGKEGFERVKETNFDAILMDIHMPEMDGIEATMLIRQLADERKRRVPIIAITAENEMQLRQQVYEVGMNDYIFKPFNPDDLKERLGYALYNNTLNISNFKAIN
ncbi:MAG: tetratricopeptide repeat protein [Bacteroidota bacterium]|nr:tetratricopeptide repeat protein [Bacteroidota bacterium]